jgi:hypothetical protein
MPSQPSIHLKKQINIIQLYFSIFNVVANEHSHYICYTLHNHYHHSRYTLLHTRDHNDSFFLWLAENQINPLKILTCLKVDMAPLKTPNMQRYSKSSGKTWSTPPHPLSIKSKKKQDKLSSQQKVSFTSLMFATTKATTHFQRLILHLKQTSLLTIGNNKKTKFLGPIAKCWP